MPAAPSPPTECFLCRAFVMDMVMFRTVPFSPGGPKALHRRCAACSMCAEDAPILGAQCSGYFAASLHAMGSKEEDCFQEEFPGEALGVWDIIP